MRASALLLIGLVSAGCQHRSSGNANAPLRLGFFPNVTHGAALLAVARGEISRRAQPVPVETHAFNAGPAAMEALFAGALDATYIGPGPAVSGYVRAHGEAVVIVAGAAANGAALVVRGDSGIKGPDDLHGKKLATPQLGNTQDLALRTWLRDRGLKTSERGGDVQVTPLANPDILSLMKRGQLDGAWVPEPWVSRLVHEAGARVLVDEKTLWPDGKFPTAVLLVTRKLVTEHPELVRALVEAHVETVSWARSHDAEARKLVDDELEKLTHKRLPPEVMADAWAHVELTWDPLEAAIVKQANDARALGYLGEGDLSKLVERRFLDEATGAHD